MDEQAARQRLDKFVATYLGTPDRAVDAQAVCIRAGSAAVYIRLLEHDPRFVRVFSPLLHDVEESCELLQELNDINSVTSFARLFWLSGTVYAAAEQLSATLDLDELVNACDVVGSVADKHDNLLLERFGGRLSFDEL
jgi:hypothetical protein